MKLEAVDNTATTLLCPFARAIQCLEARDTTLDDIYLYWLAIIAAGRITNYQFSKMIENEQAQNIYLVAFALQPDYRNASILDDPLNPLSISSITITPQAASTQMVYLAVSSPRFLLSRRLVLVSSSCSKKSIWQCIRE